ncbi:MAG: hypothetical protein WDN44_07070 [Sphingomonas sp.]
MRWILLAAALLTSPAAAQRIDRHALVSRHDVVLDRVDPHAPLMLGNGNLGFTRRHHRAPDLPRALFEPRAAADDGAMGRGTASPTRTATPRQTAWCR